MACRSNEQGPRWQRIRPDLRSWSCSRRSSIDLVRDVARASGGPAYVFYAPFTVRDAATAQALREQPEVVRAFSQVPRVTKAVAGLGLWGPGESTLYDAATERDRRALRCSTGHDKLDPDLAACPSKLRNRLTQDGGR